MNPLTVKLFDVRRKRIGHYFLDMCATTGTDAAKASVIFEAMNNAITSNGIPWTNCVGLSVDNANVNTGVTNSISSRLKKEQPEVYVHGCPCHILHNTAHSAAGVFTEVGLCITLKTNFKKNILCTVK